MMNPEQLVKLSRLVLLLKSKVKCSICLDHIENTAELECSHRFCNNCLTELKAQSSKCPLCSQHIGRRAPVYRDQFADDLSKFTNLACQLIKEKYAHEVDELCSKKKNLQEIIDTAPQDIQIRAGTSKCVVDLSKVQTENDFDERKTNSRQSNRNKGKQVGQVKRPKVLSFDNDNTKTKIINWLNDNQKKLDILTQCSQLLSENEVNFQMPSISQVPPTWKQKQPGRTRSQSLTLNDNLPLLKRYKSLTEGLNENDDYNIEEVHSETLVKQVERKVIQDMLEDECLENLDQVAQLDKEKPKATASKKRTKSAPTETKNCNVSPSASSDGWQRMENVKKAIERTSKKPKKLNIKLQGSNSNTKKSPKGNSNKSPGEKKKKVSLNPNKTSDGKKNHETSKEPHITEDELNAKTAQTFNLSVIENYFDKHMDNVKILPKDTSFDMEIDIIDITNQDRGIKDKVQNKENVSINDQNCEEQIFCAPTQITPHSANQHNEICYIPPIPKDFNDLGSVAIRLSDNLKSCISSAANLHNNLEHQLVECFTNLLTYSDRIIQITSQKVAVAEKQTNVSKKTQTVLISTNNVATQSMSLPVKTVSSKCIQTSQHLGHIATQTDAIGLDRGVQTIPGDISKNITEDSKTNKLSTPSISNVVLNDAREVTCSINFQDSKADKDHLRISDDDSKEKKSGKASNEISQGSVLLCSLDLLGKPEKKTNRQLTYEESQNRKFKRIRKPASDSESDEDGNPSKRKFIRDDLTVEFLTERPVETCNSEQKDNSAAESENLDYDKYLLEIMKKYDPSPPKIKAVVVESNTQRRNAIQPISKKNQITDINDNKYQRKKSQKLPDTSSTEESEAKPQKNIDSGEHIFTANMAFHENLDKFDQEILEFERTSKTYNTEIDLVENTPLASPKPNKIPRLSTKKKDSIEIISKGNASDAKGFNVPIVLATGSHSIDFLDNESSVLNRNIINLPSQTEKCAEDVADILKDIRDDENFFKSNMDCDERQGYLNNPRSINNDVNIVDLSDNDKTNVEFQQGEKIHVHQGNIDKVLENLNDFDDDDEIEEELRKISFTAAQKEVDKSCKINILQNIKLQSQNKKDDQIGLDGVIEGSDISDEEIVETTPQKKRNFHDRSFVKTVINEGNAIDPDVCLSPPPGFGDEDDHSPPLEDRLREIPESQKENCLLQGNKSSVTPDRLSDFIFTPDDKPLETEKDCPLSMTFKESFITPTRSVKGKIIPKMSQLIVDNSESVFSPIAKTSIRLTQAKYTPLVSSRPTRKPNLMTSTPNQKSILNYVVPTQESPSIMSQKQRPCIMWSRILNKDLNIFTQLECRKLLTTSKVFGPQVTHLVVLVDEKGQIVSHTAKILQAIAAGIWVVRYEWAQDSLKMNRIVPEEPYEALDSSGIPGPQISRSLRNSKPLFKGFKFYCAPPLKTVSKEDLESILQLSGGEIAKDLGAMLENDGNIHIILTESSATEETDHFDTWLDIYKVVTVDMEWLTSCIGQYKVVSFRPFLISGDESKICDLRYPQTLIESVPYTLTETS